jgi:hypothetical protein
MLPSRYSPEKAKQVPDRPDGTRIRSLFFFHRDRNRPDGRETDSISFDLSDEAAINEVVMALVASFATVFFSQLDAVAFYLVDSPDVDPIGPDYFHVLFDVSHWEFSMWRVLV